MKYLNHLLVVIVCIAGCGDMESETCQNMVTDIHNEVSSYFTKARRCEVTKDISTLEVECGCEHTKKYGGVRIVHTISCEKETTIEESYPYYGLRFRYREEVLEFVGGKQAGILSTCYNTVWNSAYNGCQTKTVMYCL